VSNLHVERPSVEDALVQRDLQEVRDQRHGECNDQSGRERETAHRGVDGIGNGGECHAPGEGEHGVGRDIAGQ
jgi:hypothetical protein